MTSLAPGQQPVSGRVELTLGGTPIYTGSLETTEESGLENLGRKVFGVPQRPPSPSNAFSTSPDTLGIYSVLIPRCDAHPHLPFTAYPGPGQEAQLGPDSTTL